MLSGLVLGAAVGLISLLYWAIMRVTVWRGKAVPDSHSAPQRDATPAPADGNPPPGNENLPMGRRILRFVAETPTARELVSGLVFACVGVALMPLALMLATLMPGLWSLPALLVVALAIGAGVAVYVWLGRFER